MKTVNYNKKILGYPASYAERRMWFLHQLENANLTNNMGIVASLHGDLNLKLLQKAWQKIVDRHEILRTNFSQTENGEIIQVIKNKQIGLFNFQDLSLLRGAEKQKQKKIFLHDNKEKLFDLKNDCLWRFDILKIKEKEFIIAFTCHHIIADAWTLVLLWHEFYQLYEAACLKKNFSLAPLTVQYKDYAAWELSEKYLKKFDCQKKYWLEKLKQAPAFTRLPLDNQRPSIQTYHHNLLTIELTASEIKKLEKICAAWQVTWYTLLLSAYFVLLAKVSGEEDLLVGSYAATRDQAEMNGVAGIFLNNVAIRVLVKPTETWRDLAKTVNQTIVEAMQNKEYPFEKLIDQLKIKREAALPPLFNTVFQVFNKEVNLLQESFPAHHPHLDFYNTNFFQHDLVWRVGIDAKKIGIELQYNSDLFTKNSLRQWLEAYHAILRSIARGEKKVFAGTIFPRETEKAWPAKYGNNQTQRLEKNKLNLTPAQAETEKTIIKIWSEVLGVNSIKRDDNFFYLGGHSLKLIQVYERLDKIFPGKLQIAQLFYYYTPASLAQYIESQSDKKAIVIKKDFRQTAATLIDEVRAGQINIENAVDQLFE